MTHDKICFNFDDDRIVIIKDPPLGRGANCIASKCNISFHNSDNMGTGILKEFVPEEFDLGLIESNGRYRFLPAQRKKFIERYNSYKEKIIKVDNLLNEIAKSDQTIGWYYDSSSIYDCAKNQIFELDEDNNRYRALILMPYESEDSSSTIKNFSIKERINALIKLCSVVEKFHSNNLIIADLKPKNFLYANDGITSRLKIIDFDSVLMIDNQDRVKPNQTPSGSNFYSSPQIKVNDVELYEKYAKRADIYSIGALLLNFVTIKIFDEISQENRWFEYYYLDDDDLYKQLNDKLYEKLKAQENDKNITKGFWNKFVHIVLKSMSSNPADRYENMSQIREELISLQEIYENKGVHPEVMLNKAIERAKNIKSEEFEEELFTSIKEVND